MNGVVPDELPHVLALTARMSEAAAQGNWALAAELDELRQVHLQRMQTGSPGVEHREALATLKAQNDALLERVREVLAAMEEQLSEHQYKHRALQAYVTSAGS